MAAAPLAKLPCLHVNMVIVMESVFVWKQGDINGGIMTGEK